MMEQSKKIVFIFIVIFIAVFIFLIFKSYSSEDYIITVYSNHFITIEHNGVIHAWAHGKKQSIITDKGNSDEEQSESDSWRVGNLGAAQQYEKQALETGDPHDFYMAAVYYQGIDNDKTIEMANKEIEILLDQPEPDYNSAAETVESIFKDEDFAETYRQKSREQIEICGGQPSDDNDNIAWAKFKECIGEYRGAKDHYYYANDFESVKRIKEKMGY